MESKENIEQIFKIIKETSILKDATPLHDMLQALTDSLNIDLYQLRRKYNILKRCLHLGRNSAVTALNHNVYLKELSLIKQLVLEKIDEN